MIKSRSGVTIDAELAFHVHTTTTVGRDNSMTLFISLLCFDIITFPYLYKALIHPLTEYGNVIWNLFIRTLDQLRIESVHCKAIRLVHSGYCSNLIIITDLDPPYF